MLNPITLLDTPVSQQFAENPGYYQRVSGTPGHNGLDLACGLATQLYSPIEGVISELDVDPYGWGLYLKISEIGNDNGQHYLLAHLSSVGDSKVGDQVVAGTPIALSGSSGNSTGPHVHVGWRPNGAYRNTLYHGWCDPEGELARLQEG